MDFGRRDFIGLGLASAAGICIGRATAQSANCGKAKSRSWYNGI